MNLRRKIVSYTLYGNDPRYTLPLFKNASLINVVYPGWEMHVYHDDSVNDFYLANLAKLGVTLIDVTSSRIQDVLPKLWRFFPALEPDLECIIFRDADSILTHREAGLVNEWLDSEFVVHIIRDHPLHISPILAGMFGVKKAAFSILAKVLHANACARTRRTYDYDQVMLADCFYPVVRGVAMIHTAFFRFYGEDVYRIEPVPDGYGFIGAIDCQSNYEKESDRELILSSSFLNGISYTMAKLFRYRIRPVFYSSMMQHFILKIFRIK